MPDPGNDSKWSNSLGKTGICAAGMLPRDAKPYKTLGKQPNQHETTESHDSLIKHKENYNSIQNHDLIEFDRSKYIWSIKIYLIDQHIKYQQFDIWSIKKYQILIPSWSKTVIDRSNLISDLISNKLIYQNLIDQTIKYQIWYLILDRSIPDLIDQNGPNWSDLIDQIGNLISNLIDQIW